MCTNIYTTMCFASLIYAVSTCLSTVPILSVARVPEFAKKIFHLFCSTLSATTIIVKSIG